MDIAALSTGLSQMKLAQEVSVAVASKAMDISETASQTMIDTLERSVQPHVGNTIDIRL